MIHDIAYRRADWSARVQVEARMTADATAFHLTARIVATEGDAIVSDRSLHENVPRLFV